METKFSNAIGISVHYVYQNKNINKTNWKIYQNTLVVPITIYLKITYTKYRENF